MSDKAFLTILLVCALSVGALILQGCTTVTPADKLDRLDTIIIDERLHYGD